jgi:hypothetical protein
MLKNTEEANKGQSRETGNKTKENKTKAQHICFGHHYMETNTYNVNKTCTLLQTTEGNVAFMWKS